MTHGSAMRRRLGVRGRLVRRRSPGWRLRGGTGRSVRAWTSLRREATSPRTSVRRSCMSARASRFGKTPSRRGLPAATLVYRRAHRARAPAAAQSSWHQRQSQVAPTARIPMSSGVTVGSDGVQVCLPVRPVWIHTVARACGTQGLISKWLVAGGVSQRPGAWRTGGSKRRRRGGRGRLARRRSPGWRLRGGTGARSAPGHLCEEQPRPHELPYGRLACRRASQFGKTPCRRGLAPTTLMYRPAHRARGRVAVQSLWHQCQSTMRQRRGFR